MEKLAIFDVDYTITKKETMIEFYKFMILKDITLLRHVGKIIKSALYLASGKYKLQQAKEEFLAFFQGKTEAEMSAIVTEFYDSVLSKILYKDGIDMINKLKGEGFKVYLISASVEMYLNELYKIKSVDKIIGTRLKVVNGKYVKGFEGNNNKGEEKVKRLLGDLKRDGIEVDFSASYMFSDSMADLPLLELVGNPFLINYKKKNPAFKVLNWS